MDGSLTINGGTILDGGNHAMTQIERVASNSQKYIYSTKSFTANEKIYIVSDETTIRTITIPKNIQYLYYTSPNLDSSYSFSESAGSKSASDSNDNSNSNSASSSSSDDSSDEAFIIFNYSKRSQVGFISLIILLLIL